MPRNLPPRFRNHIARARRVRIIGGSLLVTCLLFGTGAALAHTQLPSAIAQHVPKIDLQLPTAANQLAASATSFQSVAEKIRNLFCRWLACGNSEITQQPPQPAIQQRDTLLQNVRQPAPSPEPIAPADSARSATTSSQVVVSNSPPASTAPVINQPNIERIREVPIAQPGANTAYVDARLAALQAAIEQRMAATENANATSFRSVSQSSDSNSSGTVAASAITGTITNAIDAASAIIDSLTTTELIANNATTTNLYVFGTATIGSGTGLLQTNTGVVSALTNGSNGQVLKMVSGAMEWSADLTGSGGGSSAWATTSDSLALYPADTSDVLIIGASATSTTGNILEVNGSSLFRNSVIAYGLLSAPRFTATSSLASILPYASTTAITAASASTTNLVVSGVPGSLLKTNASGQVAAAVAGTDYLDAATTLFSTTSANFWQSTRNFFSTTSADYWETQQTSRIADDLTNNSIEELNDVAAITENYGDLLFWNGSSWADIATSSLGLPTSATLAGYLALSDWFGTTTDVLDEGSVNRYYTDARVQTYLGTIDKGFFFSTTSADYWKSITNFFSTSSASYFASLGLAFATTSNDYWQSQRNFFSTTSADVWKQERDFFSTTSATYFAHSSTTIPKTYTSNTFTAQQTFATASTTNISATYASSTQGFFGSLSIGSLSGFLKATAGAIATAAIDLASDVTGILGVNRGGTGWANVAAGAIPYGNGASALATTSAGTNGQVLALLGGIPTWTATTTFSSGLTYSGGNVTLDTSGNWTGTFDGLDGSAYLANAFSTTSADTWKLNRNFFASTSADYWKSVTDLFSTSSATYFAHSSTTIPKSYAANTWTGANTFSALTLGSLNGPLHANAGVLSATTSIGVSYGGTGLTNAPSYGQLLVGNSSDGYTLAATSSLKPPDLRVSLPERRDLDDVYLLERPAIARLNDDRQRHTNRRPLDQRRRNHDGLSQSLEYGDLHVLGRPAGGSAQRHIDKRVIDLCKRNQSIRRMLLDPRLLSRQRRFEPVDDLWQRYLLLDRQRRYRHDDAVGTTIGEP